MAHTAIVPVTMTLTADTDTVVYTVPNTDIFNVVTVSLAATGADTMVRLAVGTGISPVAGEYILYDYPISKDTGPIRLEKEIFSPDMKIFARAGAAGVNVVVTGLKET